MKHIADYREVPRQYIFRGAISDLIYKWRGGATVNIHIPADWEGEADCLDTGQEVDMFTLYGEEDMCRPTRAEVIEAIQRHEEETAEEGEEA